MAFGHLARRDAAPRADRPVVMAIERAVIEALRFQEDHRIVVLDRRDQQALGVIGVDGMTVFSPETWAKIASGLGLWVWPPKMPPP